MLDNKKKLNHLNLKKSPNYRWEMVHRTIHTFYFFIIIIILWTTSPYLEEYF